MQRARAVIIISALVGGTLGPVTSPALAAAVAPPRFQAARAYQVPPIPVSVAVTDVDLDGRADILVPGQNRFLSWLRNLGPRTFAPAVHFDMGTGDEFVKDAVFPDLNGDGFPDMAAVSNHPGTGLSTVVVLINDGGTGFLPAATYPQDRSVGAIDAGDVDGDGDRDLVITTSNILETRTGVAILANAGDGTFSPSAVYSAASRGDALSLTDLDGDGDNDVVSLDWQEDHVAVFLGDGQGGLGAETVYPAGDNASTLVVGNVNLDDKPDVMVGRFDGDGWLLLNNGDGTFAPAVRADLAETVPYAIGDLQGDGIADLAASGVTPLLGLGDGTFRPGRRVGAGSGESEIAIGDLDADGKQDLAVAHNAGNVATLYGFGNGRFLGYSIQHFGVTFNYLPAAIETDVSGDGWPDLVISAGTGQAAPVAGPGIAIALNQGGWFAKPGFYPIPRDATGLATADFNEDDILDLAASLGSNDPPNLAVLLGTGGGSFATPVLIDVGEVKYPRSITTGDFDGDAHMDVALGILDSGIGHVQVGVLLGAGDGTFGPTLITDVVPGETHGIVSGNFDADANLDVAVYLQNDQDRAYVMTALGTGDGRFAPPVIYQVGNGPGELHAADLDGNGAQDLVASVPEEDEVVPLLGAGDGSFVEGRRLYSPDAEWLGLADFNQDTVVDILVIGGSGILWSRGGVGDGTFDKAVRYAVSNGPILTGDVDRDGSVDVVLLSEALDISELRGRNP